MLRQDNFIYFLYCADFVKSLTSALARYTQDVTTVTGMADKREPEYVLYDTATTTLNIYR